MQNSVDSAALAELVTQLYEDVFALRQGAVSITALVKPNALLLIGREESVKTVLDLVERLDRPVAPDTQFQVFRLRQRAPRMALMPGDQDTMDAVPNALDYTPVYMGRK